MLPFILFLLVNAVDCASGPIVATRYGLVEGAIGSYKFGNYEAFLGLPFAEPPIGEKRFQLPIPFNSTWTSPYNATYFRDACVQNHSPSIVVNISEDCLYLNVWRPELKQQDSSQLLPVYYHIHGAAYKKNSGATPDYRGDVLAASQRIIFINSNYRLGVFGFGYGSPDGMPGNVGLYDTILALQWIQDNIRSFGGNPEQVTLTGLSSGAIMATLISTLPQQFNSRSFFSRAILMSGSATNRQQVESPSVGVAKTRLLASKVNCLSPYDQLEQSSSTLSNVTIDCLKKRSADSLLKAQDSPEINAIGAIAESPFIPVYGNLLIPGPAMVNHIEHLNNVKDVPMLFGREQDESKPFPSVQAVKTLQDAYNFTREGVTYAFKRISKVQIDSIFSAYFTGADPTDTYDLRSRCVQLTSDISYKCPSLILSELFSLVSSNIFLYENIYVGQTVSRPFGTYHSDDAIFGQGAPYREPDSYTDTDREFSSILMRIYGDFVMGIPFTNWTPVHLDKNDPSSLQTIKRLTLTSRNVLDHHQRHCMGWAELFNYQIPTSAIDK